MESELPPSKRLCLESAVYGPHPSNPPPLNQLGHIPSNIRVQSLPAPPAHPLPPLSAPSFVTMQQPTAAGRSGIQNSPPIASLLDKRNFAGSPSSHLEPKAAVSGPGNSHQLFPPNSSGGSMLPAPQLSALPPPPPYNYNTTPSSTVSTRPGSPAGRYSSTLLNQFPPTQPSSSHPESLSGGTLGNPVGVNKSSVSPQTLASSLVSRSQSSQQQTPVAASKFADSINSNSKSVVLQLIQLYKQYQELNDREGMGRVHDQLNLLVSAQQKILAAQSTLGLNNVPTTSTAGSGVGLSNLLSSQLQPVPKSATVGMLSNKINPQQPQHQHQQQQANQILSQLVAAKSSQTTTVSTGASCEAGVHSSSAESVATGLRTLPSYSEASNSLTVAPGSTLVNTSPSSLGQVGSSSSEYNQQNNGESDTVPKALCIVKPNKSLLT